MLRVKLMITFYEIAFKWMPQSTFDYKSILGAIRQLAITRADGDLHVSRYTTVR